jgi:hypothetical protein
LGEGEKVIGQKVALEGGERLGLAVLKRPNQVKALGDFFKCKALLV